MIRFFRKKTKDKQPPQLLDIEGQPIQAGDIVLSQRYELGKCKVELEGLEYFYQSLNSESRISYVKMIDAITGYQKVKKCEE